MLKNKTQIIVCALVMILLSISNLQAQTPAFGTNYYYLTRGVWKLAVIEIDTFSIDTPAADSFQQTFYVGNPNIISMYTPGDSAAVTTTFQLDIPQKQITIDMEDGTYQIYLIDLVDDNMFIYRTSYNVNGTLYTYRFKMKKI